MRIPYGIADFYSLRAEGQLYVDRTGHIRTVEDLGKPLLFLRPRRFGKSLWLSTLATYYDLRLADEHEALFGDLAIGRDPTPLAHRFFVLRWDFSEINPDPPRLGINAEVTSRHQRIGNEIYSYLSSTLSSFVSDYREHLPEEVRLEENPFKSFDRLLDTIRRTPYRLYLLIDEYDNFANEIMTADQDLYHDLVRTEGPFKYLFKWVKAAMGRKGIERLFITGVSPVVMSDVTSGMNIARAASLNPRLADLCGFTDQEVDDLIAAVLRERGSDVFSAENARLMTREWYNGYRFALEVPEKVYNPTLVLYFLLHLWERGVSPRQMLDSNLAADEGKLDYLARVALGQDTVVDLIRHGKPLEIRQVMDRFTLRAMLEQSAQDASFLGSFLFYFGMLTLRQAEPGEPTVKLELPNEVVRGLYVDRIRQILMPLGTSRTDADKILFSFLADGNLEPLLDFIETELFPTFSNRDATWANELTVKTLFLVLLWNDIGYITHSEPELGHGYADLCLLRRPDARQANRFDLLFEFKRLSLKTLGMKGEEVRESSRQGLMQLKKVRDALDKAESQALKYRKALEKKQGEALKLRSFAVVALGFERLVTRPLP